MSKGVLAIGAASAVAIVVFLVMFVVASLEMSLGAGLADVASTWWGIVTLADLGAGLVVVAIWICCLERSAPRAIPWVVGLFLLGNFTTLIYLLYRARQSSSLRAMFLEPRETTRGRR